MTSNFKWLKSLEVAIIIAEIYFGFNINFLKAIMGKLQWHL